MLKLAGSYPIFPIIDQDPSRHTELRSTIDQGYAPRFILAASGHISIKTFTEPSETILEVCPYGRCSSVGAWWRGVPGVVVGWMGPGVLNRGQVD